MSNHRYTILVLDLDGTTLAGHDQILPEDRAAARRLADIGVQVTIATGRLFGGTRFAAEALGVEGHVAVMNGSEHVHARTHEVRHRWSVPQSVRRRSRELIADHGLDAFLFASQTVHHGTRTAHMAPYLHIWSDRIDAHQDIFEAPAWEQGDDVLGISAVGKPDQIRAVREALEPELPEDLSIWEFNTFSGERFMQLRHTQEDKATALRRLAAERGATAEQTVAVGDWTNDLPMLRAAGHSFAMRGSSQDVIDAADAVLDADRSRGGAVAAVAKAIWGV